MYKFSIYQVEFKWWTDYDNESVIKAIHIFGWTLRRHSLIAHSWQSLHTLKVFCRFWDSKWIFVFFEAYFSAAHPAQKVLPNSATGTTTAVSPNRFVSSANVIFSRRLVAFTFTHCIPVQDDRNVSKNVHKRRIFLRLPSRYGAISQALITDRPRYCYPGVRDFRGVTIV